jgi:hypothetical protein
VDLNEIPVENANWIDLDQNVANSGICGDSDEYLNSITAVKFRKQFDISGS